MSVTFFILIWHLKNPQTLTEKLKQLIISSLNIAVNMRSEYTAARPTPYHLQKFAGLVIA